ncbi:SH3 domain-containing protein [uncultured Ilyobacter sp.]|uniref:SH3 domain-containing protein n=1 Tax=uncultured Ilyobacter sp. TaxID=544433 RepID=UPI0029F59899|nr:SH3 domain-containing protein [uncultured Ilyobacter sp.]
MKKFLLIIFTLVAFYGCASLEEGNSKVKLLKDKLIKIQNENINSEEEIKNFKKRISVSKNEISEINQKLATIKALAEESETIHVFQEKITPNLKFEKKYPGKLPENLNYVFVISRQINLREGPTTISTILSNANYLDKLPLLEEVTNKQGTKWYKVLDKSGREVYVHSSVVVKRIFMFNTMVDNLNRLDIFINSELKKNRTIASIRAYVPNPNNVNLKRKQDRYGNVADQSATAYSERGTLFIPDSTIISIDENEISENNMTKIKVSYATEDSISVHNSFISKSPKINRSPNKAIVIDTNNQNFGVFERIKGEWVLISYVYSKTGSKSRLGFRTPKGFFIVPNAKKIMTYNSEIGKKQGYAQYAIRFSGGGYIHATPFSYDENKEATKGWKEETLGTYPGTRKCVRNKEDHAKFLFDWVLRGKISNENYQSVYDNVAVIVM